MIRRIWCGKVKIPLCRCCCTGDEQTCKEKRHRQIVHQSSELNINLIILHLFMILKKKGKKNLRWTHERVPLICCTNARWATIAWGSSYPYIGRCPIFKHELTHNASSALSAMPSKLVDLLEQYTTTLACRWESGRAQFAEQNRATIGEEDIYIFNSRSMPNRQEQPYTSSHKFMLHPILSILSAMPIASWLIS